jgi:hypothetical protein
MHDYLMLLRWRRVYRRLVHCIKFTMNVAEQNSVCILKGLDTSSSCFVDKHSAHFKIMTSKFLPHSASFSNGHLPCTVITHVYLSANHKL